MAPGDTATVRGKIACATTIITEHVQLHDQHEITDHKETIPLNLTGAGR
jgi:hypothetical protein